MKEINRGIIREIFEKYVENLYCNFILYLTASAHGIKSIWNSYDSLIWLGHCSTKRDVCKQILTQRTMKCSACFTRCPRERNCVETHLNDNFKKIMFNEKYVYFFIIKKIFIRFIKYNEMDAKIFDD